MTSISDTEVVNAPGGLVELGYAEITNTITVSTTTEGVNGQSIIPALTVVCDGSPIIVEFVAHRVQTGINSGVVANLIVDGANQGRITFNASSTGGELFNSAYGAFRLTPSSGTHTFAITAFKTGSPNGYVWNDSGSRTFLRVSKIIQASQLLVTQSNAPIVTSLPAGNLVTGQEVDLYVTTPYAGYQRHKWNGSAWYMIGDSRSSEWQSFTPGLANITLGNGTLVSRYTVDGKRIHYIGKLTWGSTTSASGYFVINLPNNAYGSLITGSATMIDGGTRAWVGNCAAWSAGQFYVVHTESGNFGGLNQSNPFTWGSGDILDWNITYEMA